MAIFTVTKKLKSGEELKLWKTCSIKEEHQITDEPVLTVDC